MHCNQLLLQSHRVAMVQKIDWIKKEANLKRRFLWHQYQVLVVFEKYGFNFFIKLMPRMINNL